MILMMMMMMIIIIIIIIIIVPKLYKAGDEKNLSYYSSAYNRVWITPT